MSALANMPDMHSSIYSIMQDNLKSELKYYPVLGFSDAGFFSKKTLGLCHKPHKTLIIQNFALQSGYATASYSELCFAKRSATAASFFAVHWSKHFATQNGLLSKFCYAKPPIQNFASQSGLRPPHLSLRFISVSGLRCFWPPRFLRGAYLHGQ